MEVGESEISVTEWLDLGDDESGINTTDENPAEVNRRAGSQYSCARLATLVPRIGDRKVRDYRSVVGLR